MDLPKTLPVPDFGLEGDVAQSYNSVLAQRLNIAEHEWKAPSFYSNISFYDQIRKGDVEGLLLQEMLPFEEREHSIHDYPLFSDDPKRNMEYAQIASIALSMQAAIEGGLDPNAAYALASAYYRKVGYGQTHEEYFALNYQMVVDFAKAVRQEHTTFHKNPIVRECDRYIINHLTTPFSLAELTEQVGYSAPYLQRLYKQETGRTMTAMLRLARIRLAMYWLQHTTFPVAHIAQQLCFSSHSHFGAVFKELTGKTPREYRKDMQNQT